MTMKVLLLLSMYVTVGRAFQFMKGWKMPTYDPHEEAVKEKFGDKSTYTAVEAIMQACNAGGTSDRHQSRR